MTSGTIAGAVQNIVNSDGSFTLNGTATSGANVDYNHEDGYYIHLEQGKTYTLSVNNAGIYWRLRKVSENTNIATIDSPSTSRTFTANATEDAFLYFVILNNSSFSSTNYKVQLEKGSTATDYEPYVGGIPSPNPDYPQSIQTVTGRQVVKVEGKNLLNVKDNLKTYSNGLDFSFSDNKLVASGTPTVGYANVTNEIDVDLPAGDYTFSISNAVNHRVYVRVWYEDSTYTDLFLINAGSTSRTSTLVKKVERIRVDFSMMAVGTAINESFALQLEKGSTATDYEPYHKESIEINLGSIELCKISDYQDYIYKDGDDWKVHKENTKATFNGTEAGWNATGQAAPYFISLAEMASSNYCDGISTHFKNRKAYPNNAGEFAIRTEGRTISFNKSGLASMDEWLSWLGNNNVTAYYPLAARLVTDTAITDQTLIAQLEALVKGGSEEGTTYIKVSATDPNLPAKLYVEAAKYD
jgi:hypothetical protein